MPNSNVMILGDDDDFPNANMSWADAINTGVRTGVHAGDGFTVTGTVTLSTGEGLPMAGAPMRAELIDEPEDDVPLDEARRIAAHRQREINRLLGD